MKHPKTLGAVDDWFELLLLHTLDLREALKSKAKYREQYGWV